MKYVFLLCLFVLASCDNIKNEAGCISDTDHTVVENGQYKIYIYNPDSLSNPSIWEGPICVENAKALKICEFTESLIKTVEFSGDDTVSIVTFSGSNSQTTNLNLATCTEF